MLKVERLQAGEAETLHRNVSAFQDVAVQRLERVHVKGKNKGGKIEEYMTFAVSAMNSDRLLKRLGSEQSATAACTQPDLKGLWRK
ncbi:MAG: hypothetical protein NZ699_08560 [Roseiflexus sp.]|nr:hypothetical protein [Roseiflexus sp.]MDW8144788.1 hypothetical protein [Roseiflexaceae bacterium]